MASTPDDPAALRQAWGQFCDVLRESGEEVLRQSPTGDELDRAEGFRYLSRLVRSAFEGAFEAADPSDPRIEPMYAARTSIAQRNPDQIYLRATLAPDLEYRLRGRRGSGGSLSFVTRSSGTGGPEEGLTGFLDGADVVDEGDGTFEIVISRRKQARNWLPMSAGSDLLMIRELFGAPGSAVPSVMTIERLDGDAEDTPLSAADVVGALAQAGGMINGLLRRFGGWTIRAAERPNRLWTMTELLGEGEILRVGGSPGIDYALGYWAIGPDQALVVDVPDPPGQRWSFQLMNYWQENLNLPWSGSSLNDATATPDDDGSVHLVVARDDPGVANWIDTARHDHGVMLFRRFDQPAGQVLPEARLVPLDGVTNGGTGDATWRRRQAAPGYLTARIG